MPLNKDALTRYRLIDERLRNTMLGRPSLDALITYVSDKMEKTISRRTILLDLRNMKESPDLNYYAPIDYDRAARGYRYTEEGYSINNMPVTEYELQGLEIARGLFKQFSGLPIIRQLEEAIFKIADAVSVNRKKTEDKSLIHLDTPPEYKGLQWITEIAEAIRTRNILRIRYQSFDREEPREYRVEPYHLREYGNRFYVFAKSIKGTNPGLRTFGLDRILEIWPSFDHFDEKKFDEAGYFKNVIGITVPPDSRPEKIVLSFTPQQAKYVKAQPIHQTQTILEDNDTGCRIALELIVNPELVMLLLSYGAKVKVLQPKSLADMLEKEIRKMGARYS